MTNPATSSHTSCPVLRENKRLSEITRVASYSPQTQNTHFPHLTLLHLFMLSRRRGQSRLSFAVLMSNSSSFHPADLPCVAERCLWSGAPSEGSLTPFSDPSKWELRRGSLISLSRFALSPAPLFPATHL